MSTSAADFKAFFDFFIRLFLPMVNNEYYNMQVLRNQFYKLNS